MTTTRALDALRVLDITQVMAGPFCAMLLADFGADVIKIEPPEGDATRRFAGSVGTDSPAFNGVNRGKRSAVVNLKHPAGREVLKRLVRSADILIENYRPGVMTQFGLDYATLASDNPGLIYASISGYGQTGPDARKGGFDLIAQGVSGIMSVTGEPGGPPVKAGVPLTDLGAGLFALVGILTALESRHRTGHGQHVETSLLEAGVALSVWEATEFFATGEVPQPMGSAHRLTGPYQAIRCADGYITIGGGNDRLFRRLAELLGHPEWASMPEFADNTHRVRNRDHLARLIEAITITRPRAYWLQTFEAHEIPCGPINNYAQVFDEPQVKARDMALEVDHPALGRIRTLGSPLKLSATPPEPRRRAPLLGEHTDAVLEECGMGTDEIADLRREGAIG